MIQTHIDFVSRSEAERICKMVWDGLIEPIRIARWSDFAIPCGGTHVAHTGEVGTVKIRGIKSKKGKIRVGYDLSPSG